MWRKSAMPVVAASFIFAASNASAAAASFGGPDGVWEG